MFIGCSSLCRQDRWWFRVQTPNIHWVTSILLNSTFSSFYSLSIHFLFHICFLFLFLLFLLFLSVWCLFDCLLHCGESRLLFPFVGVVQRSVWEVE